MHLRLQIDLAFALPAGPEPKTLGDAVALLPLAERPKLVALRDALLAVRAAAADISEAERTCLRWHVCHHADGGSCSGGGDI